MSARRSSSQGLPRALALLAVVAAWWPADVLAQGCAMCKTALDGPPDALSAAFDASTLFLMSTPYAVVATGALWLFFAARRRGREPGEDSGTQEHPS